jgi:PAS domain S-box-containing protein
MERTSERLLLVDDDAMNLDLLAQRLEHQGFDVSRASSGLEALEQVDKTKMDLVLLDQQMPEITGIEVLRRLRSRHTPSELPVIMVTAGNDAGTAVEALNLGANDYITKPLDFEVALARIRAQLSRRAAEHDLREKDRRDACAARGSNDGLWDWNLESNEIYYSPRWKEMLGCSDHEIENSPAEWLSRIHPDDSNRVQQDLEAAISGMSDTFECEHRLHHKDSTWRWVQSRGKATRGEFGKPLRLAGSHTDVTKSKMADPLTNLPNRMLFVERVGAALAKSGRQSRYAFAVLLLDIDRFKLINESLGHLVGDELLVGVARRLRDIDKQFAATLVRLGGDEFAILADDVAGPSRLRRLPPGCSALSPLHFCSKAGM